MDPQVDYHAVLGRHDRRSGELVVGRPQSFPYLKDLVLHLAQRLRDLVLTVMLQLEENGLGFVDNLSGTRYLRDNFTPPTLDVCDFPLEVQKPRASLKSFLTSMATVAASSRTMSMRLAAALSCALRPSISFSTCNLFSEFTAACDRKTCRRVSKMTCCPARTSATEGLAV